MLSHMILVIISTLVLAYLPASSGQLSQPDHNGDHILAAAQQTGVYIVHVRKPEHMLSAGPEEVEQWHRSFLPTTSHTLDSGEPRMVFSYKVVISGFAARLTAQEVKAMETKEGFLYAQPDEELTPQTTHTPDFLGLRPNVWSAANRGEGCIVGVVDSGIDHEHVSFQASRIPDPPGWHGWCHFDNRRTCNGKLIGATYVVEKDKIVPPVDNNGHGTHVAGIASGVEVQSASIHGYALGTASGTAPDAYLAMYGASDSGAVILNAIEQAILDGVHLISISMGGGGSRPFYDSSIAKGTLAAIQNGIMVSAAAGNRGPDWCTVENDAPWIMTVGASTMGRVLRWKLSVQNGVGDEDDLTILGESVHYGRPIAGEIVYPGANGGGDNINLQVCTDLGGVDVVDKVVMCYTTEALEPPPSPQDQALAIQRAGGVAMVLMNTAARGSIITNIPDLCVFPVVAINHGDSLLLINHVGMAGNRPVRVEILPVGTSTGVAPFPAVPYFSSRGPSPNNGGVLKPDILGPGVNVLAARRKSCTEFTLKSGTSMATPHLSGIAAILKQHLPAAHPGIPAWTPAMIRSAIITTAQSSNRQGNPITDQTDQPADMMAVGAGHVDPAAAMDPGLVYDISHEDYIKYLCGLGYTDEQVEITSKMKNANCDDPLRRIDPTQLNYPSISVTLNPCVPVKTVKRTATHVSSDPTTYTAEVTLDVLEDAGDPNAEDPKLVDVKPEILEFKSQGENLTFELTFTLPASYDGEEEYITGKLRWVTKTHTVTSPLHISLAESQAALYGC